MALVINTNNSSIAAQKNLFWTQDRQATTFQRLATGLRVNSAKDDAAGMYVITKQSTDIIGLQQATRNAGDGIAFAQTMEGAIGQISANFQRVYELAMQSANGPYDDTARGAMQTEVDELMAEAARIVATTEFNGLKLLKDDSDLTLEVGFAGTADDRIKVELKKLDSLTGKKSLIDAVASGTYTAGDAKVGTQADAQATIADARSDIATLAGYRAKLGGAQNRFEAVISNNLTYNENLQAARSRIQDTDYAVATANLAKQQVLQQAGMAVLSQSNAATQNILGLLR